MTIDLIADIVGIIGVVLIIAAFFLLQAGRISAQSYAYQLSNLVGAICLLYSLYYHWNLASVIIEILWLIISIYGLIRVHFSGKSLKADS